MSESYILFNRKEYMVEFSPLLNGDPCISICYNG